MFRLVLTEEAAGFLKSMPGAAADKMRYNMARVQKGERDRELFKKLEGTDIWEFRTLYNRTAYRLFAFWDTDGETLVVATHGLVKKTQKTPAKEIARAERIRKQYFEQKRGKQMRMVGNMKLYDFDEVLDETMGPVGTPERDDFERRVDEAVHAWHMGEAIKRERIRQNLTQEELGERVGVKKSQISRLEKGRSITIPTLSRVFKALGVTTATLDLGAAGKVALW